MTPRTDRWWSTYNAALTGVTAGVNISSKAVCDGLDSMARMMADKAHGRLDGLPSEHDEGGS